ncbi:ribonucleoside-triphosphate reductase activating protein [Ruminiclostridium papyrosolvens C7]|uniref:Anaerobic ribonucleoside-triphosphate reductase-activating protein n=2 Tax=Ruminiclostridium papyrosolvens TaxID=29362 RepID=U4R3C8_9FIRM|nr:ribonucleoside-triphosphate reductase activating protein [Ruminiclostridium papyrosolvens C7]
MPNARSFGIFIVVINMRKQIRISGIINESIVDGPGIRMVIFAQGCRHNCKGCHNSHTHSFDGGELIEIEGIVEKIRKNPLLDGVTFSGGEPFEQADTFADLAKEIKELGLNVMVYSGYTFEQLIENSKERKGWMELLNNTKILVDGPFIQEQRDLLLKFRGSANQRIIDIEKSLASGNIELADL